MKVICKKEERILRTSGNDTYLGEQHLARRLIRAWVVSWSAPPQISEKKGKVKHRSRERAIFPIRLTSQIASNTGNTCFRGPWSNSRSDNKFAIRQKRFRMMCQFLLIHSTIFSSRRQKSQPQGMVDNIIWLVRICFFLLKTNKEYIINVNKKNWNNEWK